MSVARAKRLGWSLFAFTVAGIGVMVWLSAGREEACDTILYGLLALIFSGAGALIVAKHPDNAIGWMFLYLGFRASFGRPPKAGAISPPNVAYQVAPSASGSSSGPGSSTLPSSRLFFSIFPTDGFPLPGGERGFG